ncbi:unnamed protein product [Euphydryas editha]|uniref:Uncharacterized protein n=1 Tax=Euphydryas editha TaxID=104508 RepID=A0AAU9U685_EUPED|nr:unnamed protein product [Euphydryas editha]
MRLKRYFHLKSKWRITMDLVHALFLDQRIT